MKTRLGFVSNSSSSSFIVISDTGDMERFNLHHFMWEEYSDNTLIIGGVGETEFGWQREQYNDVNDKINFAWIQAKYLEDMGKSEPMELLMRVLKEYTESSEVKSVMSISYDDDKKIWSYIDHESAAPGGNNIEMFDNEDKLKAFLFNPRSYIQNENDN